MDTKLNKLILFTQQIIENYDQELFSEDIFIDRTGPISERRLSFSSIAGSNFRNVSGQDTI